MLENSNMSTYPEENTSIFLAILHIMSLGLSIVFFFIIGDWNAKVGIKGYLE